MEALNRKTLTVVSDTKGIISKMVQQAKTRIDQLFHRAEQANCGELYTGTKV
jgi:hypothetical protein